MSSQSIRTSFACGLLLVLLVSPTRAVADQQDPTVPSPVIAQQLRMDAGPQDTRPQVPPPPTPAVHSGCADQLAARLKAIVMRDPDHATAIVAGVHGELVVLTLRRSDLGNPISRVSLVGKCFEVVDFSASALVLRCVDTGRQFVVN